MARSPGPGAVAADPVDDATWELLTALAELIRRRPGPYFKLEGPARMPRVWAEGTSAEVSIQLAITARAATQLLSDSA